MGLKRSFCCCCCMLGALTLFFSFRVVGWSEYFFTIIVDFSKVADDIGKMSFVLLFSCCNQCSSDFPNEN